MPNDEGPQARRGLPRRPPGRDRRQLHADPDRPAGRAGGGDPRVRGPAEDARLSDRGGGGGREDTFECRPHLRSSSARRSPRARSWSSGSRARARLRRGCWRSAASRSSESIWRNPEGAAGLRDARRRSRPGYGWDRQARRRANGGEEPGGSRGGAGDRRRARARGRGPRRARAGLEGDPEPVPGGDRDQRQDDHGRAAGTRLPQRRRAGRGRRQRRHPARLPRRARSTPTRRSSARPRASSSRTPTTSAPSARSSSTSPPTTSIATPTSTPTSRRSSGSSPTRATTTSRSTTPTTRPSPEPTSAAAAGGSPSAAAPAPIARWRSPRGRSSTTASRCCGPRSWACSASTTSPTRWPPPRRRWRWASTATRSARGCGASPACPTGSSRSPRSTAFGSSTTRRRPTSPRPSSACGPSTAASTRSSAAATRATPFTPLADPIGDSCAACYLIGATADRLAAELAGVVEAGVPLHRCADLEDAVRTAAARACARVRSSCSRRPARASMPSRTSNTAASRFREIVEGAGLSARAICRCGWPGRIAAAKKKRKRKRARPRACRPSTTCCSPRPSACSRSAR